MPKLSYYQKAGEPGPLEQAKNEMSRRNILKATRAIDMHMAVSCIAMGYSRVFLSVGWGKYPLTSCVTRGHHPKEEYQKPH